MGKTPPPTQCAYCKQEGHWRGACPDPLQRWGKEFPTKMGEGTFHKLVAKGCKLIDFAAKNEGTLGGSR